MHSAPIAAVLTGTVWVARRAFWIPLLAWWSHIVIDVFTHSADCYAVPLVYPFTERGFDGIAWTTPWFMGATLGRLRKGAPGLESWLSMVFTVLGGQMVGAGFLTLLVARVAKPRRMAGTAWALGLTDLSVVIPMGAMNFMVQSDFRWLLLIPARLRAAGPVTDVR